MLSCALSLFLFLFVAVFVRTQSFISCFASIQEEEGKKVVGAKKNNGI